MSASMPATAASLQVLQGRPVAAAGADVLSIRDLSLGFGGIKAISDVNFTVGAGQIHSLIGPNGAGKTSLLNCISGVYRPSAGEIRLGGRDITRLPPHRIAALGLGRTFQRLALFTSLTVRENVLVARGHFMRSGLLRQALGLARREERQHREVADQVIEFLRLGPVANTPAGELSYGVQKRVEIARALALQPTLLLLDEPVAGMNPGEKEDVVRSVLEVQATIGLTCLLVEHEMDVVMSISDRVTVMSFGEVIAEGTPAQVSQNPKVIEAYLGEG